MRSVIALLATAVAVRAAEMPCSDHQSCRSAVAELPRTLGALGEGLASFLTGVLDARDPEEARIADLNGLPIFETNKTWCPKMSYFDFVPGTMATVAPTPGDGINTVTWEGLCAKHLSATIRMNANAAGTKEDPVLAVDMVAADHDPLKLYCYDLYVVATSFSYRFVDLSKNGNNKTATIASWRDPNEAEDVRKNGVRILQMPCGVLGTVVSVINTASMYAGAPNEISKASIDFLTYKNAWSSSTPVPFGKQVRPTTDHIKSGDYMAVLRLDGLDPMIAWATGGRTGHSVVLVWEGDQLYAVESTAPDPFGASYWPCPTGCGIIRTKWEQWYPQAINASYHIGLLPIKSDLWNHFDEDAFWAWFKTVEGMPYGYHTMLYSFLDTSPEQNLPMPIDNSVFTFVLNLLDDLIPDTPGNPVTVQSIFVEALNKRLNTSCTHIRCAISSMVEMGTDLAAVTAIPEPDNVVYDGNYSMVCSEFAARVWQKGFGSLLPSFYGAEQTPKDNYQSNVFDEGRFNETNCPGGVRTTQKGTYCQLMGEYELHLNDYNSIVPYAGMNNGCPSQWPYYFRCPASNPQCC